MSNAFFDALVLASPTQCGIQPKKNATNDKTPERIAFLIGAFLALLICFSFAATALSFLLISSYASSAILLSLRSSLSSGVSSLVGV